MEQVLLLFSEIFLKYFAGYNFVLNNNSIFSLVSISLFRSIYIFISLLFKLFDSSILNNLLFKQILRIITTTTIITTPIEKSI